MQSDENLDELIVKRLAHVANMTAGELREEIASTSGKKYSAQAVFKELSKLQEQGVVVRLKSKYSLSLSWAMRLVNLADVAYDEYLARSPLELIMAEENKQKTWHCSDFSKVSNFWLQAKFAMLKQSGAKVVDEWMPHPWVALLHRARLDEAFALAKTENYNFRIIVGGGTQLDTELSSSWPRDVVSVSHSAGPFDELEDRYFSVVGDYIFSIDVSGIHHQELKKLFQESSGLDKLSVQQANDIFQSKTKFAVQLKRDVKKAAALRKKFDGFF